MARIAVNLVMNLMTYTLIVSAIQTACIGLELAKAQPLKDQVSILICVLGAAGMKTLTDLFDREASK